MNKIENSNQDYDKYANRYKYRDACLHRELRSLEDGFTYIGEADLINAIRFILPTENVQYYAIELTKQYECVGSLEEVIHETRPSFGLLKSVTSVKACTRVLW